MNTPNAKHIAWRPAECHPFESAWSIAQKFCRWNGARLAELWSLVAANPHQPLPDSRQYLRDAKWLDREKFAAVFRLSAESVRNAFPERYAPTPHLEVCLVDARHLRFCQRCAKRGFHSSVHEVVLFSQCPIHHEPLLEGCPTCRKPISAEITRGANSDPYACRCGHVLWPSIRSPAFSSAELAALQTAVDWLDRSAEVISSRIETFEIHEDEFGDPQSIIVSEAVRCIAETDSHAPPYVARPKSLR